MKKDDKIVKHMNTKPAPNDKKTKKIKKNQKKC